MWNTKPDSFSDPCWPTALLLSRYYQLHLTKHSAFDSFIWTPVADLKSSSTTLSALLLPYKYHPDVSSHWILTGLCKTTLSLTPCRNIPYVKYILCKHVKSFWRMNLILLKELVCESSPAQTRLSQEAVFTCLFFAPPFTAVLLSTSFFFLSVITCFLFCKCVCPG